MTRLAILALIGTSVIACDAGPPIWIPRSKTADPLYRFVKDGKVGFIDRAGHVIISPTFETHVSSEFHDGLLEIAVSDGKYVDRTRKLVIDKGFYRGWDFSEGLAVAMQEDGDLWGYIDTTGEFAITQRFASSLNDYRRTMSLFPGRGLRIRQSCVSRRRTRRDLPRL